MDRVPIPNHMRFSTTEIYPHVSIAHLVEMHRRSHPAENAPCRASKPGLPGRTRAIRWANERAHF